MELHQRRCFVAIAEDRQFGRAVHRLNRTQPPLNRQIQ
jgi:DNA-binding transcriptional LysR family regulator